MKILLINGSSRPNGCTYTALREVADTLENGGAETELLFLGSGPIRDCTACRTCQKTPGRCVFDDDMVNQIIGKAREADGFVFGTPVYYAHPSGRLLSVLDRVFYAGGSAFAHKPGAAVASARRAGTTASVDVLNKYFTIAQMPVVSSTYWNMVHGNTPEEVLQDAEEMQTMRNLARNLLWLVQCIQAGQAAGESHVGAEVHHHTEPQDLLVKGLGPLHVPDCQQGIFQLHLVPPLSAALRRRGPIEKRPWELLRRGVLALGFDGVPGRYACMALADSSSLAMSS